MTPVTVKGSDEISVLGSAFNKLLEQLRASHASLEKRVDERTAELEQTNAELRREAVIRRRAEDDLRKYSEEISDLYNNAPCGYHSLDPDGTRLPVLLNATAIKDDEGRYIMSRSTLFDMTERRQAEQGRRVLEERLLSGGENGSIRNLGGRRRTRSQ
jgi:PAS domain-containing protein